MAHTQKRRRTHEGRKEGMSVRKTSGRCRSPATEKLADNVSWGGNDGRRKPMRVQTQRQLLVINSAARWPSRRRLDGSNLFIAGRCRSTMAVPTVFFCRDGLLPFTQTYAVLTDNNSSVRLSRKRTETRPNRTRCRSAPDSLATNKR